MVTAEDYPLKTLNNLYGDGDDGDDNYDDGDNDDDVIVKSCSVTTKVRSGHTRSSLTTLSINLPQLRTVHYHRLSLGGGRMYEEGGRILGRNGGGTGGVPLVLPDFPPFLEVHRCLVGVSCAWRNQIDLFSLQLIPYFLLYIYVFILYI